MVLIGKLKNKVFANSVWMMSEKLISIFGLIFVTSFVAKYIGPENFGKLTFASSIFSIIQTIAMFGSENIIFQKTSKNRKLGEYIIDSTKIIRDILYLAFSSFTLFYIYYFADYLTFVFSLATSVAIYFAVHDVYSIYFNAILQSK
ncbi:TPA: polysaccharide biosynthesis protein, partial [Acinetobacter baumannii]